MCHGKLTSVIIDTYMIEIKFSSVLKWFITDAIRSKIQFSHEF